MTFNDPNKHSLLPIFHNQQYWRCTFLICGIRALTRLYKLFIKRNEIWRVWYYLSQIKLKELIHQELKWSFEVFVCHLVGLNHNLSLIHLSRVAKVTPTIVESLTLPEAYNDF